ncbi:MAG TPA: hypothetical protein VF488_00755 [Gemmatimonadaceae bacterium]
MTPSRAHGEPPDRPQLLRSARWTLASACLLYLLGLLGAVMPVEDWYPGIRDVAPACAAPAVPGAAPCALVRPDDATTRTLDTVSELLPAWHAERIRLTDDCARSRLRQCQLQQLLDDPTRQGFTEARRALDEERVKYAALRGREERLAVGGYGLIARLLLGLSDVVLTWLSVRLLLRTGRRILDDHTPEVIARRATRQWAFIALGVSIIVATMVPGTWTDHKVSIGLDSFVVSPYAWGLTLVSMVGVVVMFSIPVTLLWLLGSPDFAPQHIDPRARDGECGVGHYITFLHTWTILAFAFGIVPAILWIRYMSAGAQFTVGYLVPVAGGLAIVSALTGRLIYNAALIRKRYRAAIEDMGKTWGEVLDGKPAPDPTIAFIGENWWKLPATVGALLLAIWQVLEWTGAARIIVATAGG